MKVLMIMVLPNGQSEKPPIDKGETSLAIKELQREAVQGRLPSLEEKTSAERFSQGIIQEAINSEIPSRLVEKN